MIPSNILPLILFHMLLVTKPTSSVRTLTATNQTNHQVALTRTNYYSGPYTNTYNNPLASPLQSLLKAQHDLYMMTLYIGTPPVPFSAVMDTGSDLIWTKCNNGFFNPSTSSSFFPASKSCLDLGLGESCVEKYSDGSSVSVNLGQEILSLGNNLIFKGVIFGCGQPNTDKYDGIIGMGRGGSSLVSQLNVRVFSYCLGSRSNPGTSGVLLTGSKASSQKSGVQTTPFKEGNAYYYLSLEGISIGETRLSALNSYLTSNGDGGMIIDSGTTFTYLEQHIIDMIGNEFMNQTGLVKSNDTTFYDDLEHCFMYQGYNKDQAPKLVFHFEDADWELPRENYIYEREDGQGGCLAFMASENSDDNQSIFGNMMQQNMMVIYDLDNNNLSFKPALCDQYY